MRRIVMLFLLATTCLVFIHNKWLEDHAAASPGSQPGDVAKTNSPKDEESCQFAAPNLADDLQTRKLIPEHVFVIDTSMSMIGKPGGPQGNIFPKVKEQLISFLESPALSGAQVTFYTFDQEVRKPFSRVLAKPEDIVAAKAFLEKLPADGRKTYLYQALHEIFEYLVTKSKAREAGIQAVYIYTDGKDESPQPYSVESIMKRFRLAREKHPFLFVNYVTLGAPLSPEEVQKIDGRWVVVQAAKGEVPPLTIVTLDPHILDLGNLRIGQKQVVERAIRIRSTAKDTVPPTVRSKLLFKLARDEGVLMQHQPETIILRDGTISLRFSRDNPWPEKVEAKEVLACLKFTTDTPNLVLLPQELPLRVQLTPQQKIIIGTPLGEVLPAKIQVKPWKQKEADRIFRREFIIRGNKAAEDLNRPIELKLLRDTGPRDLVAFVLVGQERRPVVRSDESFTVTPKDGRFGLELSYHGAKWGTYTGRLLIRPARGIEFEGNAIRCSKSGDTECEYAYDIQVAKEPPPPPPPPPIWKIVLLIGAGCILLFVILGFVFAPKFGPQLYIQHPDSRPARKNPVFLLLPWRTAGGAGSDIAVGNLPARPILKVRPRGPNALLAVGLEAVLVGGVEKAKGAKFVWMVGQMVALPAQPNDAVELRRLGA